MVDFWDARWQQTNRSSIVLNILGMLRINVNMEKEPVAIPPPPPRITRWLWGHSCAACSYRPKMSIFRIRNVLALQSPCGTGKKSRTG